MPQTILIVNDDPLQLRMAEFTIRDKLHYNAVTATGSEEAIRWIVSGRQPQPDLILLDLMRPKIGGLEVIRQVRAFRSQPSIIVVTECGDQESVSRAIQAGANDFLQKPVALERLKLSIQSTLTIQRLASYIEQMERLGDRWTASAAAAGQWWFLDAKGKVKTLRALEEEAIRFCSATYERLYDARRPPLGYWPVNALS